MGEKEDEEDERRETAMASAPSLHSDFKSNALTPSQLSKFQELHKRRLEIKAKSKFIQKQKDGSRKSHSKTRTYEDRGDDDSTSIGSTSDSRLDEKESTATCFAPTQRRKLHWGLDTKEWWERKANM